MGLGSKRPGDAAADAVEIVQMAWDNLRSDHRSLLESSRCVSIGKSLSQPLGLAADAFLRSAGLPGLSRSARIARDPALAVWVGRELRIVLINESHPKLVGLEDSAREQFIAHLAWHE